MAREYPKKELWKLFLKLPEDLKETATSVESANTIYNIGKRNGLDEEKCAELSKFVGLTLFGLLPPVEFQETLEKELELEKEIAKNISREIARYVFFPVKSSLEELYKIEITPAGVKPVPPMPPPPPRPAEKPEVKPVEKEEKPVTDIYREPIE